MSAMSACQCRCEKCGLVYGVKKASGLHIKYKKVQLIVSGRVTLVCWSCDELNEASFPANIGHSGDESPITREALEDGQPESSWEEGWCCQHCDTALGVHKESGIHIRYKHAQFVVRGYVMAVCWSCSRINETTSRRPPQGPPPSAAQSLPAKRRAA